MKQYLRTAALLLPIVALFTESLAAQSDRPRQRSGPIRSVPVAADIKRDDDFDCPEEFGYYPHPTDCTLYYVCVFGGALLESCTGGLMYSHELQTCDWPRNVGCDATNAGAERAIDIEPAVEVERLNEREPPVSPPRRTPPPPPPPRAQPNPVVTSRGQPKITREEYVKQQQLYAEVDDLPPIEEIESDRQQRVYRGQPSTIGQVQRDRDGYSQANPGRNINSNIIPASISQGNGKIGSFSFGTQVDERRAATVTQAPQTYSVNKSDVSDPHNDRPSDILTNEIVDSDIKKQKFIYLRRKREVTDDVSEKNSTDTDDAVDTISDRSEMYVDDFDTDLDSDLDEEGLDESERGKRQIRHSRYYLKNGYKNVGGKNWASTKPIKLFDLSQFNSNPGQNFYNHQPTYNSISYQDTSRKPTLTDNLFTTSNPFLQFTTNANLFSFQSEPTPHRPFKPSLPDPFNVRPPHNPINSATHIITKSPPISSLTNSENPFSALAGGFYNNVPKQNDNYQLLNQVRNNPIQNYRDSSQVPSSVVTDKPVLIQTSPRPRNKYRLSQQTIKNNEPLQTEKELLQKNPTKQTEVNQYKDTDYDDKEESEEVDESSSSESDEDDENDNDFDKHNFPKPPYEFSHPSNKYAEITNPFADPNFDFDAFLTRLRDEHLSVVSTVKPKKQTTTIKNLAISASPNINEQTFSKAFKSSTMNYMGMSTPRPFTLPSKSIISWPSIFGNSHTANNSNTTNHYQHLPNRPGQQQNQQQLQQQSLNVYNNVPQLAVTPLVPIRPKLKPPNFKDDRQLPINHNFNGNFNLYNPSTEKHNIKFIEQSKAHLSTVTPKTYLFVTGKNTPISYSTPKPHFGFPQQSVTLQPQGPLTGRPYLYSTIKPHNANIIFKQSTSKPITNQPVPFKIQQYRISPSIETPKPTLSSNKESEIQNIESLFSHTYRPTVYTTTTTSKTVLESTTPRETSTTLPKLKRRPIPKPSPEMNDYYYDDDEDDQFYYEPAVKPKYMPSSEVRPQRPPIAQNYEEYEDDENYEDDDESVKQNKPQNIPNKRPSGYNTYTVESATKNHNDVSVVTKPPFKDLIKNNLNGKIPVPVIMDFVTPTPAVLIRPELSNYRIVHPHRNRTVLLRRPIKRPNDGPNTMRPPKYLNQTTLRPYTVRHRLAKPTTMRMPSNMNDEAKQVRGRIRQPNTMTRIKLTNNDNHNQETRYTKTRHDDKTNSLEPTESVTPVSYSASPRPKMLYNGSQNYNPEQFDPYYVYDEDGELYKDTDYVQHYNSASLRPAVQQTYRGTPPPVRRPVETYTARPVSADDYDDALIQGQINNQNQYQTAVRQSTRGEGNELGYDHNPSSERTTIYEATSISTTPSTTTSTSTTTTQRPTTAPFTEAMIPSRYTQRSPTDENLNPNPTTPSKPIQGSSSTPDSLTKEFLNFSSLAKPFEKTNNSLRFRQTPIKTDFIRPNLKQTYEILKPKIYNESGEESAKKKVVSLTTGFSIRRDPNNNNNNRYTLTVLTRPFDDFNIPRKVEDKDAADKFKQRKSNRKNNSDEEIFSYEASNEKQQDLVDNKKQRKSFLRRTDSSQEYFNSGEDAPLIFVRPTINTRESSFQLQKETPTVQTTIAPKYYLKTVIKRPAPFSVDNENYQGSTENNIETDVLIEKGLQNAQSNEFSNKSSNENEYVIGKLEPLKYEVVKPWIELPVSPYRTLNNLRTNLHEDKYEFLTDSTTHSTSTSRYVHSTTTADKISDYPKEESFPTTTNSAYLYTKPVQIKTEPTTEIFSDTAKQILKAFFNNFASTTYKVPIDKASEMNMEPNSGETEKTVKIGFQKKKLVYNEEKSIPKSIKRVEIITEPTIINVTVLPTSPNYFTDNSNVRLMNTATSTRKPYKWENEQSTILYEQKSEGNVLSLSTTTEENDKIPNNEQYSSKFQKNILQSISTENKDDFVRYNQVDTEPTRLTNTYSLSPNTTYLIGQETDKDINDINTSTKSTLLKTVLSTSTKNYSPFPTRVSRVNPAIKLAATNQGVGRRSYQSSSKCSSDDSLQANPKCNEIKYSRPSPTRGRGSAHYSTLSGGDVPQHPQTSNRGTPPTRSRPTLKPSTAIVSKTTEFVDIYSYPPRRPSSVYPQPTPDKTAAKCRKDVCLLPDCYCGGRDIPGELPVESVPQIVLLTFDDSVNDLNKGLYADLFEKGRVNPNGCPISATFYVSHEWTDYSQVQNLYAGGHEMASHTISHSFGEQFSQKKWNKEVGGQREILSAYGGVKLEDVRGMRAPFLSVGGNKMFKMLYDSNFTYDSSMPVYENRPPSWPYTLDYKLFHDCMIPPCPTKSYPGVWEVPMVMWQDLNGGRCSMGDACANPPAADGVYKMLLKNFDRHYTTNRAPFGLFYHAAWFTQPHHKEGFIMFLDFINQMPDVWVVTNWQALQWVRDPTPISRLNSFQPFQCNYQDRPKKCNNPKVCNLWHKSGVRYMRTCQPCPEVYPWTGKTGIRSSRIDNEIEE